MPTFETLRLRRFWSGVVPFVPISPFTKIAPFTAPALLGAKGDLPPRDDDLTLLLLPLLNGKPTEEMITLKYGLENWTWVQASSRITVEKSNLTDTKIYSQELTNTIIFMNKECYHPESKGKKIEGKLIWFTVIVITDIIIIY